MMRDEIAAAIREDWHDPHAPGADSLDGVSPEVRKHYGLSAEKDAIHEHLTDVLHEWPIGEPFQEISRSEAVELARFLMDSCARRGIELHLNPAAKTSDAKEAR